MPFATDDEKAIKTVAQYISDGDTIDYVIPDGVTLTVGDIVIRNALSNSIGLVQDLPADSAGSATGDTAGTVRCSLRVYGLIKVPMSAATFADGAKVHWNGTNSNIEVSGVPNLNAHEVCGLATSGESYAFIRMNVALGLVQV